MGTGAEEKTLQFAGKEPTDHGLVQAPTIAKAFVIRIDEQRPDIAGLCVADRERDDLAVRLDDPATTGGFDGRNVVVFRDDQGSQSVLAYGEANAMHRRYVLTNGLPQYWLQG